MPKARKLKPQSVWDFPVLVAAFEEAGVAKAEHHATRLLSYLIRNPDKSWHDAPHVPKTALACLDAYFQKFTSSLLAVQRSDDGATVKLLMKLQDGLRIEAVVMQYDTRETDPITGDVLKGQVRSTLCVSSQVGCQMGCTFCATGTMGLQGNLTAGEIVEQLAYAMRFSGIRNIVFMGMGEPLNNYNAVKAALGVILDSKLFSLSPKHVTVSTVGVTDKIRALATDIPAARLALSLHAPSQQLRETIVPSAKAYKLPALIQALQDYLTITQGRAFIEYVMLHGVNDDLGHARELGELLQGLAVTINLIPWNPVLSPDMHFEAPGHERCDEFRRIIKEEFNMPCTIRQEKGSDIAGACGQLAIDHKNPNLKGILDIEEVAARLLAV